MSYQQQENRFSVKNKSTVDSDYSSSSSSGFLPENNNDVLLEKSSMEMKKRRVEELIDGKLKYDRENDTFTTPGHSSPSEEENIDEVLDDFHAVSDKSPEVEKQKLSPKYNLDAIIKCHNTTQTGELSSDLTNSLTFATATEAKNYFQTHLANPFAATPLTSTLMSDIEINQLHRLTNNGNTDMNLDDTSNISPVGVEEINTWRESNREVMNNVIDVNQSILQQKERIAKLEKEVKKLKQYNIGSVIAFGSIVSVIAIVKIVEYTRK